MGQLYYAQTQLDSIVLGVKFSGQYEVNTKIHYSLLGAHLFRFFSQILYQGPKQLIYTRGWRGSTRGNARQVHTVARPWQNPLWFSRILLPHLDRDVFSRYCPLNFTPSTMEYNCVWA